MRKLFLAAAVTLLLLLVLAGCGNQSAPEAGANPGSSAKPEMTAQPPTSAQPQPAGTPSGSSPAGPQATNSSPSGMYGPAAGSGAGSTGGLLTDPPIQVTPPSGDGPDWCEAGLAYAAPDSANYGFSEMKVIGLVPFKGKTYCKAEYRMEAPGQKIVYTLYFLENEDDAWMVMDINGVIQEIHLDN